MKKKKNMFPNHMKPRIILPRKIHSESTNLAGVVSGEPISIIKDIH